MAIDAILSVDELLANAKAAVASRGSTRGLSAVGKLLAGREESKTANLSPVERVLYEQEQSKPKQTEPYTEQEWFIKARVSQLKAQIALYTNLPGLDPGGGMLEGLGKEVTDLVKKQQAAIKKVSDEATAKQAELDKKNAAAYKGLTAEQMLKRLDAISSGGVVPEFNLSEADKKKNAAVEAMLKKVGATVNQTA